MIDNTINDAKTIAGGEMVGNARRFPMASLVPFVRDLV